jgi:DNA-binding MarR family transcriptional regulator
MADPVTIILALRALSMKLIEDFKDGKGAAEARDILRLVGELQTEYFSLQQQIIQLQTANFKLEQAMSAKQSAQPQQKKDKPEVMTDLNEICIAILKYLADSENTEHVATMDLEVGEIAAAINQPKLTTQRYLDKLKELKLIQWTQGSFDTIIYILSPNGIAFLVDRGLAK